MRIQYVSDIHLEHRRGNFDLPVAAPVLVLAGDIGPAHRPYYAEFLRRVGEGRERVFVVAGNHEYYGGSSMADTERRIQEACDGCPTPTTFLRGFQPHEHNRVLFVGDTLWSYVPDSLKPRINDFRMIPDFTPARARELHMTACMHLNRFDKYGPTLPVVAVTHHAPLWDLLGAYDNGLNAAFACDLSDTIRDPPFLAWISGHTHQSMQIDCRGTQVVSNCIGYPGEAAGGLPDAVVEV